MDGALAQFYDRLLGVLRQSLVRDGDWSLLECAPVWADNTTSDNFIAFRWVRAPHEWMFVAVNYSPQQSQCFMRTPFMELGEGTVRLQDRLSPAVYDRSADDLRARGLFLEMPPWGCHVFDVQRID
ncbi:hypothetical protein LJR296_006612 [Cupriavidus necator]|uniref:hypothetical protein n=1 Tax=Cupriavidus necator TaxID=106590 RepID=UPI003ED0C9D9